MGELGAYNGSSFAPLEEASVEDTNTDPLWPLVRRAAAGVGGSAIFTTGSALHFGIVFYERQGLLCLGNLKSSNL